MRPALLACRPVELDLNNEARPMADQMTFVYDGAVQGDCSMCGRKVWIGPRQQQWWVIGTPALCFLCAVTVAGADNIRSLGNPQPNPNG